MSPRRLLLVLAVAALSAPVAWSAEQPSRLRGELAVRQQDLDSARAEAAQSRADIEHLKAELDGFRSLQEGGPDSAGRRARLNAIHEREAELDAEVDHNRTELSRLLAGLELYRLSPPPALLAPAASARDAVRAAILIRAMEPAMAARARAYSLRAERMSVLRRAVAASDSDLFASESALADHRAQLEALLNESATAEAAASAQAEKAEADTRTLGGRLRAMGLPIPALQDRAPTSLVAPVDGGLIRRFGDRSPGGQKSDGFTWQTPKAAAVHAPGGGVVDFAGPLKGWGNVLVLRVGGGYHLVVAGLQAISVAPGRFVQAGQPVGTMAADGQPELYLEVRKDGAPVDPARWLRPSSLARASGGPG